MKIILDVLEKSGFHVVDDGLKIMWNPDEETLNNVSNMGKNFLNYYPKEMYCKKDRYF